MGEGLAEAHGVSDITREISMLDISLTAHEVKGAKRAYACFREREFLSGAYKHVLVLATRRVAFLHYPTELNLVRVFTRFAYIAIRKR